MDMRLLLTHKHADVKAGIRIPTTWGRTERGDGKQSRGSGRHQKWWLPEWWQGLVSRKTDVLAPLPAPPLLCQHRFQHPRKSLSGFREKEETPKHNECRGLSRDWVSGKILFMCCLVIPYGEERHMNIISRQSWTIL